MNEFLINLDFYILGTDSLWADQSFYQFWWFIDWHGRVGGGVLVADIAILQLESGSRLIIMKTVWEMLLIDQFPPPRPALPWAWAPPLQWTLEKCPLQKWARAQAGGPGHSIHAELRQHDAFSCSHPTSTSATLSCEGRADSWSAHWPRVLAILGSFIIIIHPILFSSSHLSLGFFYGFQ